MNNCGERLKNGIITENPIFVLMLVCVLTLAVTTSAINGIGMGLSTARSSGYVKHAHLHAVKVIPDSVRI